MGTNDVYRRRSKIENPKFGLVRGAQPVRAIRPRTGRPSMPGWHPTAKGTLDLLRVESQIEADGLEIFEFDPEIVMMASQPHRLVYHHPLPDGGTIRRNYHPDVALLLEDDSVVVVDFKPLFVAEAPAWRRKARILQDAYALDHRATFLTVTDAMIAIEPRRQNARILSLHRRSRDPLFLDREADSAVFATLERMGLPARIGAIRSACPLPSPLLEVDRAFTALLNMVADGILDIDHGRRLSNDTEVSWRSEPTSRRAAGGGVP